MYLLTDILYNSRSKIIPNAKNYRQEIEMYLPEIFHSINIFMKTQIGKVTSKNLEDHLNIILDNWTQWRVYEQSYITGLRLSLKVPRDFNPNIFKLEPGWTLFDSTFDNLGKAKAIATDIARENFIILNNKNKQGNLNLRSL